MKAAQAVAARAVVRVLRGQTLDAALAQAIVQSAAESVPQPGSHPGARPRAQLDVPSRDPQRDDRALAQELSYGTLRHLGRLRATLSPLLSHPIADPELDALLCVALYQLQHGRTSAHAVVSNAVDAAPMLRLTSAKGLVNAVLRNYLRRRDATGAIDTIAGASDEARYSYPQWWIDRVRADWPDAWAGILTAGNERPPLTLRVNRRRTTREAALDAMRAAGIACHPLGDDGIIVDEPRNVHELPGFDDGLLSVQDHGAQLAAPLLDARDGMRVLDACAAPGGKTTHILERSDCEVIALERDAKRLQRVRDNLDRLGLATMRVATIAADATDVVSWWDGRPFDRILADVPCSASGVVRRHPDSKWLRRPSDIGQFTQQQQQIIDAIWPLLKPGGRLLYTTCSVFRSENDARIEAFIAAHPDAVRLPLGVSAAATLHGEGQLLPVARGTDENHDGFFHALVEKRAG